MRKEVFTMERDIAEVGDRLEITEGRLPRAYYYTAEPAVAMSGNFAPQDRITSTSGVIVDKVRHGSSFLITLEFDE
ncbi:MAG: hypothetical protein IJL78_00755 [Lachnospiraceae bacterium]|nr:hypothetical protein [Lachnospiraceae bacterium]